MGYEEVAWGIDEISEIMQKLIHRKLVVGDTITKTFFSSQKVLDIRNLVNGNTDTTAKFRTLTNGKVKIAISAYKAYKGTNYGNDTISIFLVLKDSEGNEIRRTNAREISTSSRTFNWEIDVYSFEGLYSIDLNFTRISHTASEYNLYYNNLKVSYDISYGEPEDIII